MNIAVIFAGGVGKRMGSKDKPKQFLTIFHKPIIVYTLEHFQNNKDIDGIVVACVKEWIPHLNNLLNEYRFTKVKKVVEGGKSGQLSIYNGLLAAKALTNDKRNIVLIHDGVRPLINSELISANIACVKKYGSCITSVEAKETFMLVNEKSEIKAVPSREVSFLARAPQSFYLDDILSAHQKALRNNETNHIDSCSLLNHYGYKLHSLLGPKYNIKITTPEDFFLMRSLMEAKENAQLYGFDL